MKTKTALEQILAGSAHLVVDLGNTQCKGAIFAGRKLMHLAVAATPDTLFQELQKLAIASELGGIIISSVVGEPALPSSFHKIPRFEFSHAWVRDFLPIDYQTPHTLGRDRLANAFAVSVMWPAQPVLVIDVGTCIKCDFVSAAGHYLGGSISPGLRMRFRALNHFTHGLPLLEPAHHDPWPDLIGNTTTNSLLAGVLLGMQFEMNSFIGQYRTQYSGLQVVLTGGDASFFDKRLEKPIFAHPNLTLFGLNEALLQQLDRA